jgi:catalase
VKLGSISIVRVTFDQELNDRSTVFAPGNLPKGIEPADPMVAVRDATYAISYRERQ